MERIRKSVIPITIVELGNRIKTVIEDKNLKSKNVAHDAGLDVENLRKYIKGTQEMKVSTMLKIATALGVEPADLIKDLKINFLDKNS